MTDLEKLSNGAYVLADWLGSGGVAVGNDLAQRRADVCLTCPNNSKEILWHKLEAPVAAMIRLQINLKNGRQLRVNGEKNLGTCTACLCNIRTKVWTPLSHITEHMAESIEAELPTHCWILREQI